MGSVNISLAAVWEQLSAGSAFKPEFAAVLGGINDSTRRVYSDTGAEYYTTGDNGNEVHMPVKLRYKDAAGVFQEYYLPLPLVSFTANKHFVDTPLTDRAGMVAEYINTNNIVVRVRGIAINPPSSDGRKSHKDRQYPEGLMNDLAMLFSTQTPMEFICAATDPLLKPLGGMVTLRDYEVPDKQGVVEARAYSMTFHSDSVFELNDID